MNKQAAIYAGIAALGLGVVIYLTTRKSGQRLASSLTATVPMAGNGGRPVTVWIPAGFDTSKPFSVYVYFHGHGSSIPNEATSPRLRAIAALHPNTVFVFPLATTYPFTYWMKSPESFLKLLVEAVDQASTMIGGALGIAKQVVVGAASGGGLALRNAVESGTFAADSIELLDSAYGDWAQVITRWAMSQSHRVQITAWHTPGSTEQNDLEIARMAPHLVSVHASPVVHGQVPEQFLGTTLV